MPDHNKKTIDEHLRTGTYRRDRHGPLPCESVIVPKPAVRSREECGDPERFIHPRMEAADRHAIANGCYYDERLGRHVVDFFRTHLRHSKGEWADEPFELQPWQRDDLIMPLFSWVRPSGKRRFRKTYIEIPKKNGKSTLASGIGLYMLVADGEKGAEVYSAATDRDQASIVHAEAINMIDASPALAALLAINRSNKNISFEQTKSFYRAVSAKPSGKEGFNGNCCIIDELHAWYGDELWNALKFMGRSRAQPLHFVITTAGDNIESVCYKQREYAESLVGEHEFDDRFFAYIRGATKEEVAGDGVFDRRVWHKANPSMGITIDEDDFLDDVREAKRMPSAMSSMLRYGFNIWATATDPWLDIDDWNACAEPYTAEDLAGQPCDAGLDLSKTRDMTSLVLCFPSEENGSTVYKLLPYFWLPEKTAQENNHLVSYLVWASQGHLEIVPGSVMDYRFVRRRIQEIAKQFDLRVLAYDMHYAEHLTQQLEEEDGINREIFKQTVVDFAGPTAAFERLLLAGDLRHNGNPILTWQASHVKVYEDKMNGNKRPIKPRQNDHRKIDGIVAAIMALAKSMAYREQHHAYEEHGLRYV